MPDRPPSSSSYRRSPTAPDPPASPTIASSSTPPPPPSSNPTTPQHQRVTTQRHRRLSRTTQPQSPIPSPNPNTTAPAQESEEQQDNDSPPSSPDPASNPLATSAILPLPASASQILNTLPASSNTALARASAADDAFAATKLTVRLHPIGAAPALAQRRFKVSAGQRFETVVRFLRRRLGVGDGESVFCYVNSVFAPGLDEGVGNLWRCFKTGEELVVAYAVTPAFG